MTEVTIRGNSVPISEVPEHDYPNIQLFTVVEYDDKDMELLHLAWPHTTCKHIEICSLNKIHGFPPDAKIFVHGRFSPKVNGHCSGNVTFAWGYMRELVNYSGPVMVEHLVFDVFAQPHFRFDWVDTPVSEVLDFDIDLGGADIVITKSCLNHDCLARFVNIGEISVDCEINIAQFAKYNPKKILYDFRVLRTSQLVGDIIPCLDLRDGLVEITFDCPEEDIWVLELQSCSNAQLLSIVDRYNSKYRNLRIKSAQF